MNKELKVTKGHKVLFVFDIILPIISIITLIIASINSILFGNIFTRTTGSIGTDEFIIIITSFLLIILAGIMITIPVYLYFGLFLGTLALSILSICYIKTFINAKKIWIFVYIQASLVLQFILTDIATFIVGGYINSIF